MQPARREEVTPTAAGADDDAEYADLEGGLEHALVAEVVRSARDGANGGAGGDAQNGTDADRAGAPLDEAAKGGDNKAGLHPLDLAAVRADAVAHGDASLEAVRS